LSARQIRRKRAVIHATGAAISRPGCFLPHFHQFNPKVLHGLQRAMQLSLIAKRAYQDRTAGRLLDVQS
jgi:hypothetical protein